MSRAAAPVTTVRARVFRLPTDGPEADGTIAWKATTLVLVEAEGGGRTGLGYTYSDAGAAGVVTGILGEAVAGLDAMDPPRAQSAMVAAVRNIGREGIAATAISALDAALWDLKAKLLDLPLALLFGRMRDAVPIYGSGGFTTYSDAKLAEQLGGWVARDGCRMVKMKVGSDPARDPDRVRAARDAIGDATLFVDANGAFSAKQALRQAAIFKEVDVSWFEEPVSSDDLEGLALMRREGPPGMDIAAGEYAYTPAYVRRMLEAGAVDCQQADLTRIGGVTAFLQAAALCEAHGVDLSGHCAPAIHLHAACAAPRLRHLEWFHDHQRIEAMLFDGAPKPSNGLIAPDLSRPGHGLALREADAVRFQLP